MPSETCSWSGTGYSGESCGELRCSDGCGDSSLKETKTCSTKPFEPTCGDNECNGGETCSVCNQDCGRCKPQLDSWCDSNCYASNIPASQTHLYCGAGWDQWNSLYCKITLPEGKRCGECYEPYKDGDDDKIIDNEDKCPNTPNEEKINLEGCSCSQLTCDDKNIRTKNECNQETIECEFILYGDVNDSGCIDHDDFMLFSDNFGTNNKEYDFDNSGRVEFNDYFIFSDNFGLCIN